MRSKKNQPRRRRTFRIVAFKRAQDAHSQNAHSSLSGGTKAGRGGSSPTAGWKRLSEHQRDLSGSKKEFNQWQIF